MESPIFNQNVVQNGKALEIDESPCWDDLRLRRDHVVAESPAALAVEILCLAALDGTSNVVEGRTVRRLVKIARRNGIAVYEKKFRESLKAAIAEGAVSLEHTGYVGQEGQRRKGANRYVIHTPVRIGRAAMASTGRPDVYDITLADFDREDAEWQTDVHDAAVASLTLSDLPF